MKSKYSKVKITALTLTFVCATTAMVGATTLQYGDKGKSVTAVQQQDRKSTRLNSSHIQKSRMPSSA